MLLYGWRSETGHYHQVRRHQDWMLHNNWITRFLMACLQLKCHLLLLPSATRTPAFLLCPSFCNLPLMLILKVLFCKVKPTHLRKQTEELHLINSLISQQWLRSSFPPCHTCYCNIKVQLHPHSKQFGIKTTSTACHLQGCWAHFRVKQHIMQHTFNFTFYNL